MIRLSIGEVVATEGRCIEQYRSGSLLYMSGNCLDQMLGGRALMARIHSW